MALGRRNRQERTRHDTVQEGQSAVERGREVGIRVSKNTYSKNKKKHRIANLTRKRKTDKPWKNPKRKLKPKKLSPKLKLRQK